MPNEVTATTPRAGSILEGIANPFHSDSAETPVAQQPTESLRSITDIIRDLSNPDNVESLIRTRRQGGTAIRYIAWHDATRVLDLYAPGWGYEVKQVGHVETTDRNGASANKVYMVVAISIPTANGVVIREATGNEDDVTSSYGDPFSNSESMALRRAAAKFGLGRFLYNG